MSILRLYQYLETKRQSNHATGRCSKHDSGERCHEKAPMHQDPSGMLARIPFGLTTGPIEGAEILVAGCRKETVASEMRSNVLKYRDTLIIVEKIGSIALQLLQFYASNHRKDRFIFMECRRGDSASTVHGCSLPSSQCLLERGLVYWSP